MGLDYAADAHGISFIHGSTPPFLTLSEKTCSIHWNGACLMNGKALVSPELSLNTKTRLIREKAFKLVMDLDGCRLLHSLYNTKIRKETKVNYFEVEPENVPALIALFKAYPEFIKVKDLPHEKSAQLNIPDCQMFPTGKMGL